MPSADARLSIIVPCLNEAAGIVAALDRLQPLRRRSVEVIVVDGGSGDGSVALAAPLADRILAAPRGRASQMKLIVDGLAASGKRWGRFDVDLDGAHPLLRLIAFMMNWRSRLTGIATGDQGLFMTRGLFADAGGFPAIPLMEDIALSKSLKTFGAPLCLRARITASGRRWERHGVARTMLLMWRLRFAYFRGAEPADLAMRYDRPPLP
ncbi:MAG: glycosyltransferase family 2 protein [Betaproteobacteria bacterium]|nr:glycosyltransferase family 2 protein [Betaproteobacteria bacterium]